MDFTGRTTVRLPEMAAKLGCSQRHLLNEVEAGVLTALDIGAPSSSRRRRLRVPIECYRAYVGRCLTGPLPSE